MIHPDTELKFVSDKIGYGVFATAFIPKGTLVYVKDMLEIEVTPEDYSNMDKNFKRVVNKYCYIVENGNRIISWDIAKYVNHSCECNTISTGFGFEIAIKDIQPGEEITDEYGLFNVEEEIPLFCNCQSCRGVLRPDDIDRYYHLWDKLVINSLRHINKVPQPLWSILDDATRSKLEKYLITGKAYPSVLNLKALETEAVNSDDFYLAKQFS